MAKKEKDGIGFFARIIDFIFGRRNGESERQNLRNVSRQLNNSGYKYYSFPHEQVKPPFACYLYSIYRIVAPLREFFISHNNSEEYRERILAYGLSRNQQENLAAILPGTIRKLSETEDLKVISEESIKHFVYFKNEMNSENTELINNMYYAVNVLCQFCLFDFYILLKKFDNEIYENSFVNTPKFSSSPKSFVGEEIDDFLNNAFFLLTVENWKSVFDFLSSLEAFPNFDYQNFTKLVSSLSVLEKKRVLVRMAKLMKGDSKFEYFPQAQVTDVVSLFIETVFDTMQDTINDIKLEQKEKQISILQEKLFSGKELWPLKYYSQELSDIYSDKGLPQLSELESLTYLNSYYEYYVKKELCDFSEIFTIRGKSKTAGFMNDITVKYHNVLEVFNNVLRFDKMLDEKFNTGFRLKALLDRMKSDRDAGIELTDEINNLNRQALNFVASAIEGLTIMSQIYYDLLQDRQSSPHIKVNNWEEVDRFLKTGSETALGNICTHIENFLNLMSVIQN